MGDICRWGTLFLFFCGVSMSLVACCLLLVKELHCCPGNTWLPDKSAQSEQVCANALQSKVGIPSVLRFLHILFIFIDIMDSRKASNPFPITDSAGL